MSGKDRRAELDTAVDAIESAYEYFLAYAAQGRRNDRDLPVEQGPRGHLAAMIEALKALPGIARDMAAAMGPDVVTESGPFLDAVERDAGVARAAASLVLAQADIGSQLIDNLNASIHLRAVLTDLFLLDEALKVRA